jgi:hypothetical protein
MMCVCASSAAFVGPYAVDDPAPATVDHLTDHGLGHQLRPVDIDPQHGVPEAIVQLPEFARCAEEILADGLRPDDRVVDQHIQPAIAI